MQVLTTTAHQMQGIVLKHGRPENGAFNVLGSVPKNIHTRQLVHVTTKQKNSTIRYFAFPNDISKNPQHNTVQDSSKLEKEDQSQAQYRIGWV